MSQSGAAGGGWGGYMSGNGSALEGRERGARRRKIAGYLNELRQSYQHSYGVGRTDAREFDVYEDDQGIPGAFPDVAVVRSGDEEMVLFPSYARRHVKKEDPPPQHQQPTSDFAGESSGGAGTENSFALDGAYWREQWDRMEDDKAVADVDVRGWIYSPHRGPMSRKNRLLVGLARRLSGIPAPSTTGEHLGGEGGDGADDGESRLGHQQGVGARHEEDLIRRQAESILRRGEGGVDVAGRGGYSEEPATDSDRASDVGDTTSWSSHKNQKLERGRHLFNDSSSWLGRHASSDPGTPARDSSSPSRNGTQSSQMTPAELSAANAHLMARLRPFLTVPLVNTAVTVFFYNSQTSQSRTIITNDAGHFSVRAALQFVPTHVRVLASENLSATEEIQITEPTGISMISDIDDTIKHSAVGSGAREMFRNTFIRELGDLTIEGVKEWYNKLVEMGVGVHYVSNSPWQLYPLLATYFAMAGLPPGSFHLKQYSGMLQGIFEPVAERKKGTLERIMKDFPDRKFLLVGDSGEADLEVYTDIVSANPGRVVGIFIRDVTTPPIKGFFDSAMGPLSGERSETNNSGGIEGASRSISARPASEPTIERKPILPPRPTQSDPPQRPSGPAMGKLIDFGEDDSSPKPLGGVDEPPKLYRSMTEGGTSNTGRRLSDSLVKSQAPVRPSKPLALRGGPATEQISPNTVNAALSRNHQGPPPPLPPKPRRYLSSEQPASELRRTLTAPVSSTEDSPVRRQGYTPSIRGKVSSVYNSLPTASDYLYGTSSGNQGASTPSNTEPRNETNHTATLSDAPNAPLPTTPRRGLAAYPVAAAQYATNRFSSGWSGSNHNYNNNQHNNNNNNNNSSAGATKEELWKRRWARAKSVLDRQGVMLRSWRTGRDVQEEAVALVERVRREMDGVGKERRG